MTKLTALYLLTWVSSVAAQFPFSASSDHQNRLGLTFSPDGNLAFWVERGGKWGSGEDHPGAIYTSTLGKDGWSSPAVTHFSGFASDDDPFVSPDGAWLYFISDRFSSDSDKSKDSNIWRIRLHQSGQPDRPPRNQPEYLSINSNSSEYSPVVVSSGALYFASDREGGAGQGDLYKAEADGHSFKPAVTLGPVFNSPTGEWNLWVSPDEGEIIFEASSRPTNVSIPGDLYYSWKTATGWTLAVPVSGLNSVNSDLLPRMHPDGERLFYTVAPIGGNARIEVVNWSEHRSSAQE